jgi:hypothetical protein
MGSVSEQGLSQEGDDETPVHPVDAPSRRALRMMTVAGWWGVAIAGAALGVAAGCVITPVDLAGRACPCEAGWTCEEGTCVWRRDVDGAANGGAVGNDAVVGGSLDAGLQDDVLAADATSSTDSGAAGGDGATGGDAGKDTGAGGADSGAGGAGADATTPTGCSWPVVPQFLEPTPMTGLNTSGDESDCSLASGGLSAFFSTNRSGGLGNTDIWQARRPTTDAPFVVDGPVAGLNSTVDDQFPRLPDDGLEVFFMTDRDAGVWEIYAATRASPTGTFGAPQPVTGLGTGDKWDPSVTPDGLALYYSGLISPGLGDGVQHLLVVRRPDRASAFGAPALVPGVAAYGRIEAGPTVTADERVLVFHSASADGTGVLDLWFATRASASEPFSTPVPLASLNTTSAEWKAYLSPDGCELHFASDRSGNWDLYRARLQQ